MRYPRDPGLGDADMLQGVLSCPSCSATLPPVEGVGTAATSCLSCQKVYELSVFPALFFRSAHEVAVGEGTQSGAESTCFFHPEKRASIICDQCGRFLCALCDLEISGQHLCSSCLQTGQTKKKLTRFENRRVLYDRMAFSLGTLSMFMWFMTWLTAPITIYLAVRHWNSPGSLLGRSRWRFVVAIICATLQILVWAGVLIYWLR